MHPNPALKLSRPVAGDAGAALDRLGEHATEIGLETVDVAGFLDHVEHKSQIQIAQVQKVRTEADAVVSANAAVEDAIAAIAASSASALSTVETSISDLRLSAERTTKVAEWVSEIEARMARVEETLQTVHSNNTDIAAIARQVNILAINAKIEAARAGDLGRGFGVVAEAINELSRQTAAAAEGISESITSLTGSIGTLKDEAEDISTDARQVLDGASATDQALSAIAENARSNADRAGHIATEAGRVGDAIGTFRPAFESISAAAEETAAGIVQARTRVHNLIDGSESIVQTSIELGAASSDDTFLLAVKEMAAQVSAQFEQGIAEGRISRAELFSQDYTPIPGTEPQQVMAPFTEFTDAVLPPIQEAALEIDDRVVFCAAVNHSGYLATHNRKFSQPQGDDPVWNTANSRNRRIFDDRVGLKAGNNTRPFLMQIYRRDMGGGSYVLMKDLSAPIMVDGQHWGGLRLAFKV